MIGKTRHMNRLLVGEKKRCLLSPLDHAGWLGPVKGLDRPRWIVEQVVAGGATSILASPGFIRATADLIPPSMGIVLRVSLTAGLRQTGYPGDAHRYSGYRPAAGCRCGGSLGLFRPGGRY